MPDACSNVPIGPRVTATGAHIRFLMSPFAKNQTTVKALGKRIAAIKPRDYSEIALLGLMSGVLYSLERAIELSFDDARMKREVCDESIEIHDTLEAIGLGRAPSDAWLAGFYLFSAIMRIDTFYERIAKYASVKIVVAPEVHRINKAIKHKDDAGLKKGLKIQIADVLRSTNDVCELLEKVLA